jgi:cation diffusion facilitator CzcD-associated flavoprotein CzcO
MTEAKPVDVAIIGAGPYGLSVAAHLRARGAEYRIFGSPMRFWRDMPAGIALKSFDFATNIYTPRSGYRLVDYCRERGIDSGEPLDMGVFTEYGLWAQPRLVPEVEDIEVASLQKHNGAFELRLADGETVRARRVVMAVGLRYFERMPDVLPKCSPFVAHTSRQHEYAHLAGKDVTIIGAGQSAIESAVLAYENGASVRMVIRGNGVWFADRYSKDRPIKHKLLYPQTVMGPGLINFVLEKLPAAMHYAPERRRVRFTRRHLGPFGTWWLRDTVEQHVEVLTRTHVVCARQLDDGLVLRLRDDLGERDVRTDHVIAGTGYEVDVDRLPFVDRALAAAVDRVERAPRLDRKFESSVPGLYFVGPSAAFSFGPLPRFVCGAAFMAPALARTLTG